MRFLYQIFIQLLSIGAGISSLWNAKTRRFLKGRRGWKKDLETRLKKANDAQQGSWAWVHCASLGEFEQARPLLEKLRLSNKVLVSFFSPSGYEVRKDFDGADLICYLPLDTRSNARRFVELISPASVYFVKYDFWLNYLDIVKRRNIPSFLVSAHFRPEQFSGIYGWYLTQVLRLFRKIFVQDGSSVELLKSRGLVYTEQAGDLRYDRVLQSISSPKKFQVVEHFKEGSKLLIAGSSWEKDEQLIVQAMQDFPDYKMIIAPHDVSAGNVKRASSLFENSLLYSEISREPVSTALPKLKNARTLIIDNIGMLSSLYRYGEVAYIGGGFGTGLHNILEAVAFGLPVIFGPVHDKFPEAAELISKGGAFSVADSDGFKNAFRLIVSDPSLYQMASMVCRNYVRDRAGATNKILSLVA